MEDNLKKDSSKNSLNTSTLLCWLNLHCNLLIFSGHTLVLFISLAGFYCSTLRCFWEFPHWLLGKAHIVIDN
jgi:hypothetical protein